MVEQKAKTAAIKKTTSVAKSKAAAVPAAKKSAVPAVKKAPVAEKKTATTTTRKAATSRTKAVTKPSPEERYRMVETAAYFIAERHGFQGSSTEHWVEAERQIAVMLGE